MTSRDVRILVGQRFGKARAMREGMLRAGDGVRVPIELLTYADEREERVVPLLAGVLAAPLRTEEDGFLFHDGVPIGSAARVADEDAALERQVAIVGHRAGGTTFRGEASLTAPTPMHVRLAWFGIGALTPTERGCVAGAERAWARYTRGHLR